MPRDVLSRTGLLLAGLVALLVVVGIVGWWQQAQQSQPIAPAPTALPSPAGWEIRYNATIALARRGSQQTRLDLLAEMLDEDQLRHNFRVQRPDGGMVPNEAMVQQTVLAALAALVELHRKNPELDLSELDAPLLKLENSRHLAVRTEAEKTRLLLGKKS
jgi:hypothetical protein